MCVNPIMSGTDARPAAPGTLESRRLRMASVSLVSAMGTLTSVTTTRATESLACVNSVSSTQPGTAVSGVRTGSMEMLSRFVF